MDSEQFQDYLKNRYEDQVKWYSDKAGYYKWLYQIYQWVAIVLSAMLPVLIAKLPDSYIIITIVVSVLLSIATTGLKTFKYQENWISYRTIAETLKKEKHYYDADLDDYQDRKNKDSVFVERVEMIISRENSLWVTIHTKKEEKKEA